MSKALILATLFSVFSLISNSQEYPGIKKGEIEKLEGSDYLLVTHKKKSGLYNTKTKQYVIEPTKSFFYYNISNNYFFQLDKDRFVSVYDLNRTDTTCFVAKNKSELVFDTNLENFNANGYIIPPHDSSVTSTIPTELLSDNYFYMPTAGLRLIENSVIIYNYTPKEVDPAAVPLKSKQFLGEDSLIFNDNTGYSEAIYPPDIPAICNSGVKSIKTGEWQIEPKYQNIYFENDLFICLSNSLVGNKDVIYFDIYRKNADEIVATEYMKIRSNSELPTQLFSEFELTIDRDSTFYYTKSNDGMGLINLFLFDQYYYIDYSVLYQFDSRFTNETIFEPRYEFTHKIGNGHPYLAAYGSDGFEFVKSTRADIRQKFKKLPMPIRESIKIYYDNEHYEDFIVIDGIAYIDTCLEDFCLQKIDQSFSDSHSYLSLEKIGDSLINLEYTIYEQLDLFSEPLKSWDYPGEDSISFDPKTGFHEIVYPPNDPGVYESGIYDLRTKKWIIAPINAWILKSFTGFLICKPVLFENSLNLQHFVYSFQNNDGSYLFESIEEDELYENSAYRKLFVPDYKVDELYAMNSIYTETYCYFKTDGKTGLVNLNRQEILHSPVDYLYDHSSSQSFISIDEGLLRIENESSDTTYDLNNCTKLEGYAGFENLAIQTETTSKADYTIYYDNRDVNRDLEMDKPTLEQFNAKEGREKDVSYQLSRLNDSLIYIEDWYADYISQYPMQSYIYPDEDSVIIDPKTGHYWAVYPPNIPGYNRSGIYDFVNQKWLIAAENRLVLKYNDAYILFVPVLDELGLIDTYHFKVIDAKGNIVIEETLFTELHPDYRAFLIERDDFREILAFLKLDGITE
ncbi:MAG: hypothetical protein GQ574_17055 [Crocinitomix sp.]|nr:hypothetical protein [Crocinitomix sp.]